MRWFSEFVFRWFHDRAMLWVCAVEVLSPIVHEPPPLEQVRRRVGRLDPVADDVSERAPPRPSHARGPSPGRRIAEAGSEAVRHGAIFWFFRSPDSACRATACRRRSGTRAVAADVERPHRVQDVQSTPAKRHPVPRARLEEGAGRLDAARCTRGQHGYVGLCVDRCISPHGAAGTRNSNASFTNAAAFDARTVAIAAVTSRCGSAHVTHDLVLLAEHRAVWTFTGQIGIRISSTSALVTSETGRLMCGKAVAFEAVQPGSGRGGRYARQPASARRRGRRRRQGSACLRARRSRIDRTVVLRRTGPTTTTSGTPSTRSAGAPGPDGWCVGGRMAAVSESMSSSPSSAGTVSNGLAGLVGHGSSVHLASSFAAVAPRQASALAEKCTLSDPGRLGRETRCPVSVGAGSLTARAGVAQGTSTGLGASPRAT